MVKNFNHQKTIGIIGANPDSQAFILEANKLGFGTYLLSRTAEKAAMVYGADKVFVGNLEDRAIHEGFLMNCDVLVYYDETLNPSELANIQRMIVVPQGDDLLSIAQDRVLQKAFLESLSVNIAPYVTVVKPEDIKEGIRSIGYPAVLRTNQVNPESKEQSVFIYEESDIEKAASLLKYGTCVLESWLVSENELSVSAVKTASGEVKLFPIAKREYRNNRLSNIQIPAVVDEDLQEEINRVTRIIISEIDFRGVATINFLVTPANALYVGTIYPYPNILSRFSDGFCQMSTTEAHLRAVTSLPVPEEMVSNRPGVYVPFYTEQLDEVSEMIAIHPEWNFEFYSVAKTAKMDTQEAIGHISIPGENHGKTTALLKEQGF